MRKAPLDIHDGMLFFPEGKQDMCIRLCTVASVYLRDSGCEPNFPYRVTLTSGNSIVLDKDCAMQLMRALRGDWL